MFKKPKKNLRLREAGGSDDEGSMGVSGKAPAAVEVNVMEAPPARTKDRRKEKKSSSSAPSQQSVLSFGDELEGDDGEVFKVKKSSQSKKLKKLLQKERSRPKADDQDDGRDNGENGASRDTKEILDEDNKPFLRVKGVVAPKKPVDREGEILAGLDAESTAMEHDDTSEEEDENAHRFNAGGSRSSSDFADPFKRMLESGVVPTAAMIHEARKRRQRARELVESADFVPVPPSRPKDLIGFGRRGRDSSRNGSEEPEELTSRKGVPESRLVREEDHDRSDDEGDGGDMIAFSYNRVEKEKEKRREIFMDAEAGGAESEAELEHWEAQQIRKGFGSSNQMDLLRSTAVAAASVESGHFSDWGIPGKSMTLEKAHPYLKANSILGDSSAQLLSAINEGDLTCNAVRARIKNKLASLYEVHRRRKMDRDRIADELISSQLDIDSSKIKKPDAASRYTFYQELRGFMTDFVDCMNEKVGVIEDLEARMMGIWRSRSQKLIDRRRQDVKDEHEEYSDLGVGKGQGSVRKFQRASDEDLRRRVTEREGRRMRRKRAREMDRKKSIPQSHYEGMSSDDEEQDADVSKAEEDKKVIRKDAAIVFEDTVEDFHAYSSLKQRFRAWKEKDVDAYKNAFVPMCLPKIFSPLVRLALVFWNPLEAGCEDLESMDWFPELVLYCADDPVDGDPDAKLVSMVVERFVLPKLTNLVGQVWDPLSTTQTLRLVTVVKRLVEDYPTVSGESKYFQKFLKAVSDRMQWALENDVFVPLYAKPLLSAKPEAGAFLNRQFWICAKVLQNFVFWQGILSDKALQTIAVDSLLNRYMLLALNQSVGVFPPAQNVAKIRQIVSSLPRCWFAGGKTLSQLASLSRLIKEQADAVDVYGKESRELVIELATILKKLGFAESADEVSSIKLES